MGTSIPTAQVADSPFRLPESLPWIPVPEHPGQGGMPAKRSRQGCEECRKRRRKCDENKPTCGQCSSYKRSCSYKLRLVWGGLKVQETSHGSFQAHENRPGKQSGNAINRGVANADGFAVKSGGPLTSIPHYLPNGMPMPARYQILLDYFAHDVLASLSTHTSVHEDLCRGLVPAMLNSPHLLSASLALAAAGFLSRGQTQIDGVNISRVIEHLQSSGLPLLRAALTRGQMDDTLLATCIIWCLADVFAARQGVSSWRVHLQGVKAIMSSDEAYHQLIASPGHIQSALRHLYMLYLSLQTLPHLPSLPEQSATVDPPTTSKILDLGSTIDGFLGYSEEILGILQQINRLESSSNVEQPNIDFEAGVLLGKVNAMISRDSEAPPGVSISTLSAESGRDFTLCHKTFQQATLIHLYRRLYHMPSNSEPIQSAVKGIMDMVNNMTQGQPCNTWVAMAMPLFTIGSEAFTDDQKSFVLDKIHKLEVCLGSLHVGIIRQALEDMWRIRAECGDADGTLCANDLIKQVQYNIILF